MNESQATIIYNKLIHNRSIPTFDSSLPLSEQVDVQRFFHVWFRNPTVLRSHPLVDASDPSVNLAYSVSANQQFDCDASSFLEQEATADLSIPPTAQLSDYFSKLKDLTFSHEGCRFLLSQLDKSTSEQRQKVLKELLPSIPSLITHITANRIVVFFITSELTRPRVFDVLKSHLQTLFTNETSRNVLLRLLLLARPDQKRDLAHQFALSGVDYESLPKQYKQEIWKAADGPTKDILSGKSTSDAIVLEWQSIRNTAAKHAWDFTAQFITLLHKLSVSDLGDVAVTLNTELIELATTSETAKIVCYLAEHCCFFIYRIYCTHNSWRKLISFPSGRKVITIIGRHTYPYMIFNIVKSLPRPIKPRGGYSDEVMDMFNRLPQSLSEIVKSTGEEMIEVRDGLGQNFGLKTFAFSDFPPKIRDLHIGDFLHDLDYFLAEPTTVDLISELYCKAAPPDRNPLVLSRLACFIDPKQSGKQISRCLLLNNCRFLLVLLHDPFSHVFLCQYCGYYLPELICRNSLRFLFSRVMSVLSTNNFILPHFSKLFSAVLSFVTSMSRSHKQSDLELYHTLKNDNYFTTTIFLSCRTSASKVTVETLFGLPPNIPILSSSLASDSFETFGASALVTACCNPVRARVVLDRILRHSSDGQSLFSVFASEMEFESLTTDKVGSLVLATLWMSFDQFPNQRARILDSLKFSGPQILQSDVGRMTLTSLIVTGVSCKNLLTAFFDSIFQDELCLDSFVNAVMAVASTKLYLLFLSKVYPFASIRDSGRRTSLSVSSKPPSDEISYQTKEESDKIKNAKELLASGKVCVALTEIKDMALVVARKEPSWLARALEECEDEAVMDDVLSIVGTEFGHLSTLPLIEKLCTSSSLILQQKTIFELRYYFPKLVKSADFCHMLSNCLKVMKCPDFVIDTMDKDSLNYLVEHFTRHPGCRRLLTSLKQSVSNNKWNEFLEFAQNDMVTAVIRNRNNLNFNDLWKKKET
ncbi:hypothetical protein GEMRC1_002831 [Eukaryota sp. GEM-RC1]